MQSKYVSINPYTGESYGEFPYTSDEQLELALQKAVVAQDRWAAIPIKERRWVWNSIADLLTKRQSSLARLITEEMGKPIAQSHKEIEKCAWLCRYAAQHGWHWLQPEQRDGSHLYNQVFFRPLGVVLGIMPWNFPFWQVFRYAVPALTAGNVTILKHAENVPRSAQAIEDLFREAGLMEGLLQNLFLTHEQVAVAIADPRVRGISLTGSDRAGRIVASQAGRHLKKSVLELGGSDPLIILPDVENLAQVIKKAVAARMQNSGQSCIAAKRIFIHANRWDESIQLLKAELKRLKVGDPMDPQTQVGPLARADLADNLMAQVEDALAKGSKVIAGKCHREGNLVFPHALFPIPSDARARYEELFGPVACLYRFSTYEALIHEVNTSPYGLGCSIWTSNVEVAYRLAEQIEAGTVAINTITASEPALPFGGVKNSGIGRELGKEGFREFVNVQTIYES